jgi:hypothetical protein
MLILSLVLSVWFAISIYIFVLELKETKSIIKSIKECLVWPLFLIFTIGIISYFFLMALNSALENNARR